MSSRPILKLLDLFRPPEKAGRLKSFSGVTYEFQSEFFETELLPGLFNLGLWQTKGWSSRIALERYLDESYIGVLMEGGCYQERPSLRIDLAPWSAGRGMGKQHAKVYLLHFEDCIRVVVGSANLTDKGFRVNREALVAVDCTPQRPEAAPLLVDAVTGWLTDLGSSMPGAMRGALEGASATSQEWLGAKSPKPSRPDAWFLWGTAGSSLPGRIAQLWPDGDRITAIDIVSPFWSQIDASAPDTLLTELRSREKLAGSGAKVRILADARLDSRDPLPSLPGVVVEWARRTPGVALSAIAVDRTVTADEREAFPRVDLSLVQRPLHAKVVLLRGSKSSLAYVGSANCTPSGWGTRQGGANVEAGLVILKRGSDSLLPLLPPTAGAEVNLAECTETDVAYTVEETPPNPWPSFLRGALLRPGGSKDRLILTLSWDLDKGSQECQVFLARGLEALLWAGAASSETTDVDLSPAALETLLIDRDILIRWGTPTVEARFPVLVDEQAKHSLPLAPGVRLPGEHALLQYYQGRIRWADLFPEPGLPLADGEGPNATVSEVDTSRILAYQMRQFVEALPGMLLELSEVPREERALRRSLLGPVSPLALAQCVREACRGGRRSETAGLFQLLELQLILARVRARVGEPFPGQAQAFEEASKDMERLIAEVKAMAPVEGAIGAFERRIRLETRKLARGGRP